MIKGTDKGSAVVVWDREDYIKEADNQLGNTNIYEEVPKGAKPLMNVILNTAKSSIKYSENIRKRRMFVRILKDAKFARFYLLPKIHKIHYDVQGRPVILSCGYYTENTSSILYFHLLPIAKKAKSYMKDNNDFLKKLGSIPNTPDNSYYGCSGFVSQYSA